MKLYYSVLSVTFGSVSGVLIQAHIASEKDKCLLWAWKQNHHALILSYRLKEIKIISMERENKVK